MRHQVSYIGFKDEICLPKMGISNNAFLVGLYLNDAFSLQIPRQLGLYIILSLAH